jgi:hypothetical protein
MFSKLFLSAKDLEAIQQALTRNPLLASLLMISPIDAFKYLNLMPRFLDALLPTPAEDAQLVRDLVRALEEGRTALWQPQTTIPQPPPPQPEQQEPDESPTARANAAEDQRPADITLSISKATLQRAVELYARGSFKSQEFVFSAQSWLDVNAKGESIELDLAGSRARIVARLRGAFAFRAAPAGLDRLPQKISFPIEIELLAAVSVDQDNHLALRVGEGEMRILNPPLPERVAAELAAKIVRAVPSIPLVQVPTRFEIPGDPAAELIVRFSAVVVDERGLKLEFHLHD